MATVIDELTLNLGLDPSKFTAGQKSAVEALRQLEAQATKSGKETESQSKKLLDFFVNLKRDAIGFLSAFYGGKGIKDVVENITHMDASAARLSNVINTNAHALATWRIAMQEIGGSAGDADSAIGGLSNAIQDFLRNPANAPVGLLAVAKQIGLAPGEITDPIKFLEAMARAAKTLPQFQGKEGPARFAAMARDLPGMNQNMIFLLQELEKRLPAAEKVAPKDGGLGPFSEEFIASIALFNAAATQIARTILDKFVPALNDWITFIGKETPEDIEGKTVNKEGVPTLGGKTFEEHLSVAARALREWLFGPGPSQLSTEPPRSKPTLVPRGDTGIGQFQGATSYQIEENGMVVGSGVFPSAKGAAAISHVNNSKLSKSSNTSTSEVNIGSVHVNAPNATDARGVASGIKGALGTSLAAPANSAY